MHINYRMYIKILGFLTLAEGVGMFVCSGIGMYFSEWKPAGTLLLVSLVCVSVGFVILTQLRFSKIRLRFHEGWLIACMSWVYCSLLGAVPFYFGGMDYSLIGSLFESVAGFTTTGCSVFDIDTMPKCLMMWKAVASWFGGMGILVFVVSLFPALGISGQSIASAETTGPTIAKLDARYSDTGKFLYLVYLAFTVIEFILLALGPLDWFDALINTFSSVSTGGLVITSDTKAVFTSTYVRMVILVFTVLSSLNFCIYFLVRQKKFKEAFANIETRYFFIIIGVATALIALRLKLTGTYSSLWQAVKDSLCQVVSFIATSGYYVCDYTDWPTFAIVILFTLLFIGGCSMSTSGSMKVIRFAIFTKLIKRGIFRQIHPHSVKAVVVDGKAVPADKVSSITTHILLFFGVFFFSCIMLSFNNFDMETTMTTAIGFFSNTGMALGEAGCTGYFGMFSPFSQFFLCVLMITGRLEMYAVLLLLSKSFWKLDRARSV